VIAGIVIISIVTAVGIRKKNVKHVTRTMPPYVEMNIKRQSLQHTTILDNAPHQPTVQAGPAQKLRAIFSGQKMAWEPYDLASELGFKDDLARFYTFVNALNGDTLRFYDGKIWVDLSVDQGKKEEILERFRSYFSQA